MSGRAKSPRVKRLEQMRSSEYNEHTVTLDALLDDAPNEMPAEVAPVRTLEGVHLREKQKNLIVCEHSDGVYIFFYAFNLRPNMGVSNSWNM